MTDASRQWQDIKTTYLKQIEKCLGDIDHPQREDILANVAEHLDNKYAELSPAQQNWESYQQIITEMGPPEDYAELLAEEKTPAASNTFGLNAFLAVVFVIVLMIVGGYLIYTAKNTSFAVPPVLPARQVAETELAEVLPGRWITVDFVRNTDYFKPGEKQWTGDLYLKGLTFYEDGTTSGPWTWTQDRLYHPGAHTSARYEIKQIQGIPYLFMEWMSGDVTIRGENPRYYVLRKAE